MKKFIMSIVLITLTATLFSEINQFELIKDYKKYEKPNLQYNALGKEIIEVIINIYNYSKDSLVKKNAINIFDEIVQDDNYKFEATKVINRLDRT